MDTKLQAPTSIVLFGGTGDLSINMLFPALFDLYAHDTLPHDTQVFVYAHTDITTEIMRERVREKILHTHSSKILEYFLEQVHYIQGSFDTPDGYARLKEEMDKRDGDVCSNKLFYLSVPPRFFDTVFEGLRAVNLHEHCDKDFGWTRLLVEKPFGHSLESAKKLEAVLHTTFEQDQVFHVDHYLCKDMVRNMISFRFSNTLFEPLWNKEYIEKIVIKMHESKDVSTRGAFYDQVGAFRDVGQNHMLEMLSFVAMERPRSLSPKDIQQARAAVVDNMIFKGEHTIRAQYEGYNETPGVAPGSQTETFFKIHACIANERWKGVPIEFSAGKGLGETEAVMQVVFKSTPCLCVEKGDGHKHENVLTFSLKPQEEITLGVWTKVPGIKDYLQERVLHLPYANTEGVAVKGAYSKVFYDAIRGDQTLFKGQEEIYAGWAFADKVLEGLREKTLINYKLGETPT